MWYFIVGLTASIIGFFTSYYIYKKKQAKKPLMCPRNASCDKVVTSTYSTTLGIHNEVLGLVYYTASASVFVALMGHPILLPTLAPIMVCASLIAALCSVYFLLIQAFVLRAWCAWCIVTAVANISIAGVVTILLYT